VPEGIYLTGSLVLGANTTLQLATHASLVGSPDIADYPLVNIRWEGEFCQGHPRADLPRRTPRNIAITAAARCSARPAP